MILTDILKLIGNRRDERNALTANTAEDARQEAEMRRRAGGRAALMRGILNANGYGDTMTDEQIFNTLLHTQRRGTKQMSSILTPIGDIGQGLEDTLVRGSAAVATGGMSEVAGAATTAATPTAAPAPGSSYLDLLRFIQNNQNVSPPPR